MSPSPVSISQLIALTDKMCKRSHHRPAGVAYHLGAKADYGPYHIPDGLDGDSSLITHLDCSGFVRYSAARCSLQQTILDDGSVQMHEWCKAHGLSPIPYPNVAEGAESLFLAFMPPTINEPGHVWWIQAARTLECHGGRGVDRRPWNTPILKTHCTACYIFPSRE